MCKEAGKYEQIVKKTSIKRNKPRNDEDGRR